MFQISSSLAKLFESITLIVSITSIPGNRPKHRVDTKSML